MSQARAQFLVLSRQHEVVFGAVGDRTSRATLIRVLLVKMLAAAGNRLCSLVGRDRWRPIVLQAGASSRFPLCTWSLRMRLSQMWRALLWPVVVGRSLLRPLRELSSTGHVQQLYSHLCTFPLILCLSGSVSRRPLALDIITVECLPLRTATATWMRGTLPCRSLCTLLVARPSTAALSSVVAAPPPRRDGNSATGEP